MPEFSVIVPVYNVEPYISECIESVLAQSFSDFELLLIDDQGMDNSMDIVSQYAKKDARIRVLSHEHGGLPATRNVGLKAARGDYIVLVDGDDLVDVEYLKKAHEHIRRYECDMLVANNYIRYWEDKKETVELFPVSDSVNQSSLQDKIKLISDERCNMPASAWLTIYSRTFLNKHQLFYTEELRCSEDTDFFLKCLAVVETMAFFNYQFYFYRQDNGSAMTKNMSDGMYIDRIQVYLKWIANFEKNRNLKRCLESQLRDEIRAMIHTGIKLRKHSELQRIIACTQSVWGYLPINCMRLNLFADQIYVLYTKARGKIKGMLNNCG